MTFSDDKGNNYYASIPSDELLSMLLDNGMITEEETSDSANDKYYLMSDELKNAFIGFYNKE